MVGVAGGAVPVPLREETGLLRPGCVGRRPWSSHTVDRPQFPSNPTGFLSLPVLEHIARAAIERDLWVLSDEIYSRLVFDGISAPSIATLPGMAERTVISDGFSKTYSMTGWRLGYGIMPEELAARVELLITHSTGCAAAFTQYAGIAALTGPQDRVAEVLAEYQRRRDLLVVRLNAMPGLHCQTPQGAFYTFPNVTAFGKSSDWITDYLLNEAGVATLPGTAFGANGEGYIRFCFANSVEYRAHWIAPSALARL
jgi:aspartate/methionine/tyrosine aminotransferase